MDGKVRHIETNRSGDDMSYVRTTYQLARQVHVDVYMSRAKLPWKFRLSQDVHFEAIIVATAPVT
jgi:hypothetical protein